MASSGMAYSWEAEGGTSCLVSMTEFCLPHTASLKWARMRGAHPRQVPSKTCRLDSPFSRPQARPFQSCLSLGVGRAERVVLPTAGSPPGIPSAQRGPSAPQAPAARKSVKLIALTATWWYRCCLHHTAVNGAPRWIPCWVHRTDNGKLRFCV